MDLSAIGSRIKAARERKHLTQEDLAAIVDLSPTHVSVIERGVKPPKLETFVQDRNARPRRGRHRSSGEYLAGRYL